MAAHFLSSPASCLKIGLLRLSKTFIQQNWHKIRKLLGIKYHFPWPSALATCKQNLIFQNLSPNSNCNSGSLHPQQFLGVLWSPLTAAHSGWPRILYALTIKTLVTSDPSHTSERTYNKKLLLYSDPAHLGSGLFVCFWFFFSPEMVYSPVKHSGWPSLKDYCHSKCSLS